MNNNKKTYEFKTKTNKELINWTKIINKLIDKNNGKYLKIPKIDKFWKFILMSNQEFEKNADTCDVLLFTGSHIGSKLQRLVTRSRFGMKLSYYRSCRTHA